MNALATLHVHLGLYLGLPIDNHALLHKLPIERAADGSVGAEGGIDMDINTAAQRRLYEDPTLKAWELVGGIMSQHLYNLWDLGRRFGQDALRIAALIERIAQQYGGQRGASCESCTAMADFILAVGGEC